MAGQTAGPSEKAKAEQTAARLVELKVFHWADQTGDLSVASLGNNLAAPSASH
jgi:hypothetical protein